jgi:hypothetical protein
LYTHVEFEVVTAVVVRSFVFWDKTPYSPLKGNRHSPEISVDFQWTTSYYIPEDRLYCTQFKTKKNPTEIFKRTSLMIQKIIIDITVIWHGDDPLKSRIQQ